MAANEVNDIVVRLLAAADKIGGRDREEILHHVGRLSRAATRERNAAVDEMQKLRKKVVQQSADLKRLENLNQSVTAAPVAQAPQAAQPPLAGGYARFNQSRLQALGTESTPVLDYGPDYGRLSRPESLPQPMRKSTAAPNDPRITRREQQPASAGMAAVSATQPRDTTIEEQPGYGQFNQARFLALQAVPDDTGSSDGPNERSSLSDGPAPPKYSVTAANAEPVAPRGTRRSESIEGSSATMQAVDQLLDEVNMAQPGHSGQKREASDGDASAALMVKKQLTTAAASLVRAGPRPPPQWTPWAQLPPNPQTSTQPPPSRGPGSTVQAADQLLDEISSKSQSVSAGRKRSASDGDVTAVSAAKRQLVTAVSFSNGDATHRMVTRSQALLPGTVNVAAHEGSAVHHDVPQAFRGPTCTHCFQNGIFHCDGKAHCNQGGSHKCYYVLCDPATCQGVACVKIHSSQYDLKKRKPGQVRRLVIGDDASLGGRWDRHGHGRAVTAMGGAIGKAGKIGKTGPIGKAGAVAVRKQPFAGLPMPTPTQAINQMPQGLIKDEVSEVQGYHPFNVPAAVRWATSQFGRALMPGPARSNPMPDSGAIKVETSDG